MVNNDEREKIESVFKGRDEVVSKYVPMYPYSCERELKRIMVAYANSLISEVKKKYPEMEKAYKTQRDMDKYGLREDGLMDLRSNLLDSLVSISDGIEKKGKLSQMDKLVVRVGKMTSKHVANEWKKGVDKTFRVDSSGSVDDGLFSAMLSRFSADVMSRMTDMKNRLTNRVMNVLTDAYSAGESMTNAFRRLGRELSGIRRRAGMEARDAVGSLTSDMGRETGEHYGSGAYVWCTRRDDRVRECHRTLDGRIFRWNNPPEMWYRTRAGIVWTGRRCNPGEDYGCRCVAKPVYSLDGIRRMFGM